jgi:hypothetical protein
MNAAGNGMKMEKKVLTPFSHFAILYKLSL